MQISHCYIKNIFQRYWILYLSYSPNNICSRPVVNVSILERITWKQNFVVRSWFTCFFCGFFRKAGDLSWLMYGERAAVDTVRPVREDGLCICTRIRIGRCFILRAQPPGWGVRWAQNAQLFLICPATATLILEWVGGRAQPFSGSG